MKVLLFSLVFGLLVASQGEAQTDNSQFTGRWISHCIAANNIEKITEDGPFHIFMRYVEYDEENGTVLFRFLCQVKLFTSIEVIPDTYSWVPYRKNPNYPSNFFILINQLEYVLFLRENGECIEKYVSGTKEESFYAVDYAGHNELRLISVDNNALITHIINVDGHGKKTELMDLVGSGDNDDPEHKEEFNKAVREKGIPEENILNIIDHDNCPEE